MKNLIVFILVGIVKLGFGQFNQPKNLVYKGGYNWPAHPIYPYVLEWNIPDPSSTATLAGYKIYRCNDSLKYINYPSSTSYSGAEPEPMTFCIPGTMTVSYFITAIYQNPYGESSPSNIVSVSNWPIGIKEEFNYNLIEIYPNPAVNKLTIESRQFAKEVTYAVIYDVTGRQIGQEIKSTSSILEMDVSGLSEGMYFVTIKTAEDIFVKKIVVKH